MSRIAKTLKKDLESPIKLECTNSFSCSLARSKGTPIECKDCGDYDKDRMKDDGR